MSRLRTLLAFLLILAGLPPAAGAREANWWSYRKLQEKSDLIVIAKPVEVRNLEEPVEMPGTSIFVLGVKTRFEVLSVLKGGGQIQDFILHHYRLTPDGPIWNGPLFMEFDSKDCQTFLLFLARRSDGQFEGVAGQMDLPYSVKRLGCS